MLEIATVAIRIDQRDLLDDLRSRPTRRRARRPEPQEVIAWALERWGSQLAICTSFQADGMAILDMAWRIDPKVRRLHRRHRPAAAGDLRRHGDRCAQRYGIEVEVYFPDAGQVESMVRRYGPNLFQKTRPGAAASAATCARSTPSAACSTGSTPGSPACAATSGRAGPTSARSRSITITAASPRSTRWRTGPLDEVKDYIEANDVPVHPLYAKGFTSIGCAPCTRATAPGEDPRAGRWWWEKNAPKECGIHCPIETGAFEHELEAMLHPGPRRADA